MSFPTARRMRSVAIGSVIGLVLGAVIVAASPANASTPGQDEEQIRRRYGLVDEALAA